MHVAKRQRYDEPFKMETVRALFISGKPVSVYAKSIGIDQSIVHRWVKKYQNVITGVDVECGEPGRVNEVEHLKKEIASIKQTVVTLQTIVERAFKEKYQF
jgi:transposase-like protein